MLTMYRRAYAILDADTRRKLPILLLSFVLLAVFDALSIGLIFPLVLLIVSPDTALPDWMSFIPTIGGLSQTAALVTLLLALFLGKNIASIFLIRWQYRVLSDAEAIAGTQLLSNYLKHPWQSVSTRNSSELIRNGSVSISHAFLSFIIPSMTVIVEALLIFVILIMLLSVEAAVALSAFALLFISATIYYLAVRNPLAAVGEAFQRANLGVLQHLKQGIGAGREIRVLGRSDTFVDELAKARRTYAEAQATRAFFTQMPRFFLETVLVFAVAIAVFVALSDRGAEEVAAIMALFGVAALRLMTSANRMLGAVQQIRIGREPLRLVAADLLGHESAEQPSAENDVGHNGRPDTIVLHNLQFGYDPARPVLSGLSLTIPYGQSVGIAGPSGSGKSTLIDLLLGLLPPDDGQILDNGQNIQADISAWRRKIGFVPQNIYLTDDTLRANIAFGIKASDIDDRAVNAALAAARLDDFARSLPQGLDTTLGDLGSALSGGQRQRVGIARALYHQPEVIILDEATSALDPTTEAEVVSSIEALARDRTVIVVAHRLSTIRRCDRIILLDGGRIAGDGAYESLIELNAGFRQQVENG